MSDLTFTERLQHRVTELTRENEDLKGANLPLYSDRIRNLETQRDTWFREHDRLRKVLEDAPHDQNCASLMRTVFGALVQSFKSCDCWKSRLPAPLSGQNSPAGERAANKSVSVPDNADNGQHEGNLRHLTTELIQMAEDYRLAANRAAYEDIAGEREKLGARIYFALKERATESPAYSTIRYPDPR